MKASDPEIGLHVTNTFKDTEADSAVIMCVYPDQGLLSQFCQCYCELSQSGVTELVTQIFFFTALLVSRDILGLKYFFPGNIASLIINLLLFVICYN